jgi:hypothetical protein
VENDLGPAETNDIVIAQNLRRPKPLAVENRAVFALKVLNHPPIIAGLNADMPARQKDIADGHVTIRSAANDQPAIQLAAGHFLAVGFDHDVRHIDIIERLRLEGSIFVERIVVGRRRGPPPQSRRDGT